MKVAVILLLLVAGRALASEPITITAQGSDPPRYLVTIRGPDFALSNIVTAPGGNP